MSFNEDFVQGAKSEIAQRTAEMTKFADSKDFESAHREAVTIISVYRILTEQLLIHIRGKQD